MPWGCSNRSAALLPLFFPQQKNANQKIRISNKITQNTTYNYLYVYKIIYIYTVYIIIYIYCIYSVYKTQCRLKFEGRTFEVFPKNILKIRLKTGFNLVAQ